MVFISSAPLASLHCCEVPKRSCSMFLSYTTINHLATLCNHSQSFDTKMSSPSSSCGASPAFPCFEIFREDHGKMLQGSSGTSPVSLRCWETQQSIYSESKSERRLQAVSVRVGYHSDQEQLQRQI